MPQSGLQGLFSLFVVFAAAKVGEEIFQRLGQPPLIGQIVFGFLVGPAMLGWVTPSSTLDFMSEIGVIFLLFETGLDTQPEEILHHGVTSFMVALIGVLTPLLVGWWFALAAGENAVTARFVGTLLVATSIGITAKVLEDFGATHTAFGRVILGAAVLDDILGLLALSALSSFSSAHPHIVNLLLTLGFAIAFFLLVLLLRHAAVPRVSGRIGRLRSRAPIWSMALVVLLAFSVMSAEIGMAAIIGAFLAGVFLSEREEIAVPLRQQAGAVSSFVVPFFLATIGLRVSIHALASPRSLYLLAAITGIAIVTKLVACGLSALPLGRRSALLVGLGMIPRGEVGIVVAAESLRIAAIPQAFYSIGITMAVLTSLIGPMLLRLFLRPERRPVPAA